MNMSDDPNNFDEEQCYDDFLDIIRFYQKETYLSYDEKYLNQKSVDLANVLLQATNQNITCQVLQEKIESWYPRIDFVLLRYRELFATRGMHGTPRYGKKRDIAILVTGSEREAQEYMRGIRAAAITSWIFFALW
jgi:hypothetical protein